MITGMETKVTDYVPGIIFNLVLFLLVMFAINIKNIAPKYYAGDPNFSLEKYPSEFKTKIETRLNKEGLERVLPPKTISRTTETIILVTTRFSFLWVVSWSVYALFKRDHFPSKKMVWLGSLIYIGTLIGLIIVLFRAATSLR